MPDITGRVAVIFQHPKPLKKGEKPYMVGVSIPWLLINGTPVTEKGKPWIFVSTEIIQQEVNVTFEEIKQAVQDIEEFGVVQLGHKEPQDWYEVAKTLIPMIQRKQKA